MDGGQTRRPRYLPQVAVYWAPAVATDDGQPGVAAPVEIPCRWVEEGIQFVDTQGRTQVSKAIVTVGQLLNENGGVLMLGYIGIVAAMTTQQKANPFLNSLAWDIRKSNNSVSRFGRATVYQVIL
jgi:hypothetical protein